MVKLSDIASELGISIATISNALSGKGRMKEETRQYIRKTAQAMGYVMPKPTKAKSSQILVITEATEITFSSEIVCGLSVTARAAGVICPICDLAVLRAGPGRDATPEQLRPMVERCLSQYPTHPACIVYISQYPRQLPGLLENLDIPAVEVLCHGTGAQVSVNYDDQQGAHLAVSHLIAQGRKNIAMISGPVDSHPVSDRMIGYQRALIDHGLPFHPKLVWIGDWEAESGRALTLSLLDSSNRPDAIFTQNDTMAFGVLHATHEMGLRVPEDLAVVGFDNTFFADYTEPPLTSVAPPFYDLGKAAFEQAQQLALRHPPQNTVIRIPCSLVLRASS